MKIKAAILILVLAFASAAFAVYPDIGYGGGISKGRADADYVNSAGDSDITGDLTSEATITATQFIGDGSLLTGIGGTGGDNSWTGLNTFEGGTWITGNMTVSATVEAGGLTDGTVEIIAGNITGVSSLGVTDIGAYTLKGKLTAGAVEIEGSAFDINGGTADDLTSLTVANDIDIGSHRLTAEAFESDVTTGTAPFTVASTSKVSNLNADQTDGFSLDQDVLISSIPTFGGLNITNTMTIGANFIANGTIEGESTSGGNLQVVPDNGTVEVVGYLIASLESQSIDVVQASDFNIVDNDTLDLVFDFVPSKIHIVGTVRQDKITTREEGQCNYNCVITITGTDTFTSNYNALSVYLIEGSYEYAWRQNDTTNIIWGYGGVNTTGATLEGTGTWTTATKTFRITFQETETTTGANWVQFVATAYK